MLGGTYLPIRSSLSDVVSGEKEKGVVLDTTTLNGGQVLDVQVAIRGVNSVDENQLETLQHKLASIFGAEDPAIIFWPQENELGAQFQIKEEVLGQLLEPEAGCLAA